MRGELPASGAELTHNLRLVRPLGRGGMGVLWIAEHRALGNEVVVKFLNDELMGGPSVARRVAREAAAAARIRSPHVVQVFDHGVSGDGVPFIVMELLVGSDLQEYLGARGALSIRETITIVHQLAKALDKTHAAGLVHRDVKPSNVFLCDFDSEIFLKLLDFGLARRPAPGKSAGSSKAREGTRDNPRMSTTGSNQCAGTAPYMSPEQIVGGTVGPRSDIWSLGVVAFECLTGKRAFDGETLGALALAVHTLPLPSLTELRPELTPAIDTWFQKACARSSEERYESALEAAEAMATVLGVPVPPARSRPSIPAAPRDDRTITDDFTLTRAPAASRRPMPKPALSTSIAVCIFAAAMALTAGGAYHAAAQPASPALSPPPVVEPPRTPAPKTAEKTPAVAEQAALPTEAPTPAQLPLGARRSTPVVPRPRSQAATTMPPGPVLDPSPKAAHTDDLPDERY